MMRNELLRQLAVLPEDTLIGVQLGDQHVDAIGLVPWGDEGFVDLQCHAADLLEVLREWKMPAHQREQIIIAASKVSPLARRSIMAELLTAQQANAFQLEPGRWFLPGTPP
ncbi:hypothetical protein Asp14428_48690 [Actinoplanes sp. NBRC 14428]|nr:hypothetical protein Asp14428_48690 [Actinoplanes sp. NBRC 14428]